MKFSVPDFTVDLKEKTFLHLSGIYPWNNERLLLLNLKFEQFIEFKAKTVKENSISLQKCGSTSRQISLSLYAQHRSVHM